MARLVVLGEVHPDGRVVVGLIGHLDRVTETRFEFLVRVEFEPEGDRAGPVGGVERDVLVGLVENGVLIFLLEPQAIANAASIGGVNPRSLAAYIGTGTSGAPTLYASDNFTGTSGSNLNGRRDIFVHNFFHALDPAHRLRNLFD